MPVLRNYHEPPGHCQRLLADDKGPHLDVVLGALWQAGLLHQRLRHRVRDGVPLLPQEQPRARHHRQLPVAGGVERRALPDDLVRALDQVAGLVDGHGDLRAVLRRPVHHIQPLELAQRLGLWVRRSRDHGVHHYQRPLLQRADVASRPRHNTGRGISARLDGLRHEERHVVRLVVDLVVLGLAARARAAAGSQAQQNPHHHRTLPCCREFSHDSDIDLVCSHNTITALEAHVRPDDQTSRLDVAPPVPMCRLQ